MSNQQFRAETSEMLWLLGQPTIDDYLDFVNRRVLKDHRPSRVQALREWRRAADVYHALRDSESGAADNPDCRELVPILQKQAKVLRQDPFFEAAFATFPYDIVMVELDRLVVSQRHIAASYAEARAETLKCDIAPPSLFDFCLPLERSKPPVTIRQIAPGRYLFSSSSTDLRSHQPQLIDPMRVTEIDSNGPVAAIVGLIVGYGSNFMSAIRFRDRILLHNGYHRAFALRAAGITHAPCIVQNVTRGDEVRVAATGRVGDSVEAYFFSPRPPMLRDFFDSRLTVRHRVRSFETVVEVEFKITHGPVALED